STVGFEVKHLMISKVRGLFDSFTAVIEAEDLTDLTGAKIDFKFDVHSINTRNQERDKHLKSADFFDVQNYPTADFKSTKITKNNDRFEVTGDLTIKDVTTQVTFDVEFGGKAKNQQGIEVYGYEAEAKINREEFGLTWNAAVETGGVLVGKEVKIKVELELNQPNCVYSNTSIMNGKSIDENNQINNETINNDVHKLVTENLTDLVAIINRSGTIQYVNPSFKTVLNDDVSLLQKSNFFEKIHHDDQVYLKKELFSFSKKTIKKALKVEFRLQHKEGHSIDVEATIKSLNEPSFSKNE